MQKKKAGLLSNPALNLNPAYYLKIPKKHRLPVSQLIA
jgi:hypothetical protein